jgi:hypothetical protein
MVGHWAAWSSAYFVLEQWKLRQHTIWRLDITVVRCVRRWNKPNSEFMNNQDNGGVRFSYAISVKSTGGKKAKKVGTRTYPTSCLQIQEEH